MSDKVLSVLFSGLLYFGKFLSEWWSIGEVVVMARFTLIWNESFTDPDYQITFCSSGDHGSIFYLVSFKFCEAFLKVMKR